MSVIRNDPHPGRNGTAGNVLDKGVSVKCPKCHDFVIITAMAHGSPVRCRKCNYPMVSEEDFQRIVNACLSLKNQDQVNSAANILRNLADYYPPAGAALGRLASRYSISLSEDLRWDVLLRAYQAGETSAKEWLGQMCRTNPTLYRSETSSFCGAEKYIRMPHPDKVYCSFCQQA